MKIIKQHQTTLVKGKPQLNWCDEAVMVRAVSPSTWIQSPLVHLTDYCTSVMVINHLDYSNDTFILFSNLYFFFA